MKKIFAVLLTAALLVTAFAGCGSKNGGSVTIARLAHFSYLKQKDILNLRTVQQSPPR